MNMRDLAKLANVSISTVSKAFNNANDINEETKNHIINIAKENGCYGKYCKEKYPKKVIAIISRELGGDYYKEIVEKFENIIENNNCICVIANDKFDKNRQEELIEYFASYIKVDGIIVFALSSPLKKGYKIPIISVFGSADPKVDHINYDRTKAIEDAISTLIKLGHTKIGFFGEELTKSTANNFSNSLKNRGLETDLIFKSNQRFEKAGEDCFDQLIKSQKQCTAIVCAYDHIALGAMKAIKENGFSVPDDYSLIRFDNINFSEYSYMPLSTIGMDIDVMCKAAWNLMSKKLKNEYYTSEKEILVDGKFILRESISKKHP